MERITRLIKQELEQVRGRGLLAVYKPFSYAVAAERFINHCREGRPSAMAWSTAVPDNWDELFKIIKETQFPDDFLSPEERYQPRVDKDPFAREWC